MPNTFSYQKCHQFGKSIPNGRGVKSWGELEKDPEWIKFKKSHDITDNQLYYIHLGFVGRPMESTEERDKPKSSNYDDDLFPFGSHKGKKFKELPDRYIKWLSEQSWLDKWPTVGPYVKEKMIELDNNKLSKDDISNLLKLD